MFHRLAPLLLCLLAMLGAAPAAAQNAEVQTTWRLLDYVAVDYREAVRDGRVVNAGEYKEMAEFTASVRQRLAALPEKPAKAKLLAGAAALQAAVERKAAPGEIEKQARGLAADLIAAYPVPLAPRRLPDLARGSALYAQNCASCHGESGDAKTPLAVGMDPPPIAFTDRERARERSLFALYQVIDQGLEGTAMSSFGHLSEEDKWALAFAAGRFAYPAELAEQGRRIWQADAGVRALVPDSAALVGLSESALAARVGPEKAAALTAYLRSDPEAATRSGGSTLALARDRLRQSLAAYEKGDRRGATELALSAYLDGFEPVEPMLASRNAGLMARVERAMAELRAAISGGKDVGEVRSRVEALDSLFDETERALAPEQGSDASTFLGAFTILLREGLEALLIVVAMLAFLRKADRAEMVRPVHLGWIAALVAGLATWWAATHLISISGANRELTEGFGSILAAVILLFVGIWMHGKAQADEWQRYIREKVGQALSRKSAWFLFLLAFVAVYREVFETILFFTALSAEGRLAPLLGGAAAAAALLTVIAVLMFRFSRKLPIAKFFSYSSLLIAGLAVVLAGKGVSALQEAGLIGVTPLDWVPRWEILGLYPTLEGLLAQLATLLILLAGFARNRRGAGKLATA
ncbi:MAG TPA: cytochrome c/FTR1 family iron permease [Allosphingosinicella sp.]|nr:cytochrome c/FTR1 family iron permease [Allosphingosinicella sp.]